MTSFIHRILSKPGFGLALFLILFLAQYSFAQQSGGQSTLAYKIYTTDSVIVLAHGTGSAFFVGQQIVEFANTNRVPTIEYALVRTRRGDTLFVATNGRGVNGTTARIWPPGDIVYSPNPKIVTVGFTAALAGTNTSRQALTLLLATKDTITSFAAQPDVPRVPALFTNKTTIAGIAYFHGLDVNGNRISENDTIVTSASEFDCKNSYASLDTVILPIRTHSTGDSVSIGDSPLVGIGITLTPQECVEQMNLTSGVGVIGPNITVYTDPIRVSRNTASFGSSFDGTSNFLYYFFK
jgi:hypothetical protein